MPVISSFCGMTIYMYGQDHNPPHFHVKVGDNVVVVNIKSKRVVKGVLSRNQKKLLEAWCILHETELLKNWDLLSSGEKPAKIPPLT